MRRYSSVWLAVVLALVPVSAALYAQERDPKRVLGGHSFVPNP